MMIFIHEKFEVDDGSSKQDMFSCKDSGVEEKSSKEGELRRDDKEEGGSQERGETFPT